MKAHSPEEERRWNKLVDWLRSHGMKTEGAALLVGCRSRPNAGNGLFALKKCPPASLLFTIPASAMINRRTLERHYPPRSIGALTAIQLLSLHLSLSRPVGDQESSDVLFGPYISVLPRDFSSHPLAWKVAIEKYPESSVKERKLLKILPPSAQSKLQKLTARFWEDWGVVSVLMEDSDFQKAVGSDSSNLPQGSDTVETFLWAWLSVNTRCVYYRTKARESDLDNLTMCPVLDFANHTVEMPCMSPVPTKAEIWNAVPKKLEDLTFLSPTDVSLEEGEEIYLKYGSHSNCVLFVEYGFTIQDANEYHREVDVQDLAEHAFQRTPNFALVKYILEEEGYWGDWKIDCWRDRTNVSYRLVTALRLHYLLSTKNVDSPTNDEMLQPWRDVISGSRYTISEDNEAGWRGTLVEMCTTIITRAENVLGKEMVSGDDLRGDSWFPYMHGCVMTLWKEEMLVASLVKEKVLMGVDF